MQNNNKRDIFNNTFIRIKQSKCSSTGKNVAKTGEKRKKEDKKECEEDMTTFRQEEE